MTKKQKVLISLFIKSKRGGKLDTESTTVRTPTRPKVRVARKRVL